MLRRRSKSWRFFTRAELAADDLLGLYGVAKAAPRAVLTPPGFERVVRTLIGRLAKVTGPADAAALRSAARGLDKRWDTLSSGERDKVISAAAEGLRLVPKVVVPKVTETLRTDLSKLVETTKRATGDKHAITVAPSLSASDQRVVDFAATSQGSYITDQYGARALDFEQRARTIVSEGLEAGAGRDDIAERLAAELTDPMLGRARAYWDQVASIHASRARSYGQVAAYTDAGIERYVISAARDEVTCVICYFMNGKTFSVSSAMDAYSRVESSGDHYAVEDEQPFVRVGSSEDGDRFLYADKGGATHFIAQILSDPSGERDGSGRYGSAASSSKIEEIGCQQPPFHGRCRCLTIPG